MVLEDMEGNENVINETESKTAFEKEVGWNQREVRLDGNVLKESDSSVGWRDIKRVHSYTHYITFRDKVGDQIIVWT